MLDPAALLIHVGYHKTGTSWLQTHLFARHDRGYYPATNLRSAARIRNLTKPFADLFVSDEQGFCLSSFDFDGPGVRQRILAEALPGVGVPVISNERLTGSPHSGGFDSRLIADRLHAAFPEARVFVVIREQVSMAVSCYFQYLFAGGTRSLTHYLTRRHDGNLPTFSPTFLEYDRLIGHYQSLFGADRVLVLPFEMFVRGPEAFVAELTRFSGAEPPAGLDFGAKVNEGRNRFVEYNLRFLNPVRRSSSINGYTPLYNPVSSRALTAFKTAVARLVPDATTREAKRTRKAEAASILVGRYGASNARTAQLTGLRLHDYGYELLEDRARASG